MKTERHVAFQTFVTVYMGTRNTSRAERKY